MQTLSDCRIARSQGRFADRQRFLEVKPRGGIALLLEPERAEAGVRLRGCGVDAVRFGLTPQCSLQAHQRRNIFALSAQHITQTAECAGDDC